MWKEAHLDFHFGKVVMLTGDRGTCEEDEMKIIHPRPVQLRLCHVTCSGQLNVNRCVSSLGGSHSSLSVVHQVVFSQSQ